MHIFKCVYVFIHIYYIIYLGVFSCSYTHTHIKKHTPFVYSSKIMNLQISIYIKREE